MKLKLMLAGGVAIALCNCSSNGGRDGGTPGTGSTSGGGDGGAYNILTVETGDGGFGQQARALAIGPTGQIGVAYLRPNGNVTQTYHDIDVVYAEYKSDGTVAVPPSVIREVQRQDGITVAFDDKGHPAVGFVGGGAKVFSGASDGGALPLGSTYWLQGSAEIAYRQADGGWFEDLCMDDSTAGGTFTWSVPNGSGGTDASAMQLINEGNVVGLWPSLVFDGGAAVMAFRDVHFGQFPIQDWSSSDTKMCSGGPAAWTYSAPMTIDSGGGHKGTGYGTHTQILFGQSGRLAVVGDSTPGTQGSLDRAGADVYFVLQSPAPPTLSVTDWSLPYNPFNPTGDPALVIGDTQSGPVMAYDPSFGYGIAVVDASKPTAPLVYVSSSDGVSWGMPEQIYQLGSGGFFPSIAVDPLSGNPTVAYTICSQEPSVIPGPGICSPVDAELDLAIRTTTWTSTTVFKGNFYLPKLAFEPSGQRVLLFTDFETGILHLAIENVH